MIEHLNKRYNFLQLEFDQLVSSYNEKIMLSSSMHDPRIPTNIRYLIKTLDNIINRDDDSISECISQFNKFILFHFPNSQILTSYNDLDLLIDNKELYTMLLNKALNDYITLLDYSELDEEYKNDIQILKFLYMRDIYILIDNLNLV